MDIICGWFPGHPGTDGGGIRADAAAPGGTDRRAEGRVGGGVEGEGHEHHEYGSVKARNEINRKQRALLVTTMKAV